MNREQWLNQMAMKLRPMLKHAGADFGDIRVSCGFPSRNATRGNGSAAIGQCWSPTVSADGTSELFISPLLSDPVEVAAVLLHELVHAAVGCEHGHKAPFAKVAKACGLEGKMTATVAGDALRAELAAIIAKMKPYPHAALDARSLATVPKQSTRMVKLECGDCGYTVRTTRKWLEVGVPSCPCGCEMKPDAGDLDRLGE